MTLLPDSTSHLSGSPALVGRTMIHASPGTCQHREMSRSRPERCAAPPSTRAAAATATGLLVGPVGFPVSGSSSVAWMSACDTALAIHVMGPRTSPMAS